MNGGLILSLHSWNDTSIKKTQLKTIFGYDIGDPL